MVLTQIKPWRIGFELRTFQGINCDHVDKVTTETPIDEMDVFRAASARFRNRHREPLGYMGIEVQHGVGMTQVVTLSFALLLLLTAVWANVSGGSLAQNNGAWVSHAGR